MISGHPAYRGAENWCRVFAAAPLIFLARTAWAGGAAGYGRRADRLRLALFCKILFSVLKRSMAPPMIEFLQQDRAGCGGLFDEVGGSGEGLVNAFRLETAKFPERTVKGALGGGAGRSMEVWSRSSSSSIMFSGGADSRLA